MLINLISNDNGAGLTTDATILRKILEGAGHEVDFTDHKTKVLTKKYDLGIFLEILNPRLNRFHKRIAIIPNPEWWFGGWDAWLNVIEVWVKTNQAMQGFSISKNLTKIGFTSRSRKIEGIKPKRAFFHLAGHSEYKSTAQVLEVWNQYKDLPPLTVVCAEDKTQWRSRNPNVTIHRGHMSDEALSNMMNEHLFHLCPSQAEGWGHYIGEAMSIGAIVITTDGEPMRELIGNAGLLTKALGPRRAKRGLLYTVGSGSIAYSVFKAMDLTPDEVTAMQSAARSRWEDLDAMFAEDLIQVVERG